MTFTETQLTETLPHRKPMILIRNGEIDAMGTAVAIADTSEACLFYDDALDGCPALTAIEYMAQTMAMAVGFKDVSNGRTPGVGFVLGSRRLDISTNVFKRGHRYRITAKCDFTDEEFAAFNCAICDDAGAIVASGTLTAYRPSDIVSQNPKTKKENTEK